MENNFVCTKCGECCKHIDRVPELNEYHNGDGICVNLVDNMCSIYDERPDICRVNYMYEIRYSKFMAREEYYRLNMQACETLKKN